MANLNRPNQIIDKALTDLKKGIEKVEPRFVKLALDWLEKFETSSGNLSKSKDNQSRVSRLNSVIDRFLINSGYDSLVQNYLVNFDLLSEAQKEIHKDLNGIELTSKFVNVYKNLSVNNVIAALQGQGLDQALVNPLKQELFVAVAQGSSLKDVIKSVSAQITTTDTRQGILTRVVTQASRDALGQYEGIVNEAVRKQYKLNGILYVGSLVKDSRPQCERWVNFTENGRRGLLLFSQLEEEIDWALDNGTGFIKDTTPENFCQNRGGYNCRHVAYPIRIKETK